MLYEVVKGSALQILRALFKLEVHGTEHIPPDGPALLVANHSSLLDPPLVAVVAPRKLHFLAKAELFGVPLFGAFIRALGARPVHRGGAGPMALRLALRILEEGHVLLVFPEGTRGSEGVLGDAKGGAGMLALQSRAPVVPTYIEGSGRALPRGRVIPRPGRVRVRFGPPLRFTSQEWGQRKSGYLAVSREMMAAIARLQAGAETRSPDAEWGPVGLSAGMSPR
jgi:1-acyl-sn-glycerol-3-phosphate acyltransferase